MMTKTHSLDMQAYTKPRRDAIESELEATLSKWENDKRVPVILSESMRYSLMSPGKRMRALLCLAACETVLYIKNGAQSESQDYDLNNFNQFNKTVFEQVKALACSIEMIHAMSLIHDDLPCLDNDDMRRGKATNHVVFGEAMALLAGDALILRAVENIIEGTPESVSKDAVLEVIKELSIAAGAPGMVGGQVFDLLKDEDVKRIHDEKTGALIAFSLWSGARFAMKDGASVATKEQLDALREFGLVLGLAFQIADDLLDINGSAEVIGKTPGKDVASDKVTWVSIFGEDGARKKLSQLQEQGEALLNDHNLNFAPLPVLFELLRFAITRSH
ncbi:MAG: polyprenyl synthetase family protein [Candidatus Melainabacteria bacterium]|nr:polyprenyl synthetase family protein [Candidatus Melainabacteria bacterium]